MTQYNIQKWPIEKVIPYPQNAKKHDKAQVSKIAKSIKEFGWVQPIVVDQDGIIIAGHGRRLAAISLDHKEVPVWVRDDLTPEQVRALRLVDNRVSESQMDSAMFRKELAELGGFDLTGMFDEKELQFELADLGTLSTDGFVDDIAGAVDAQAERVKEIAIESSAKPIPIAKVLGFKEVSGANQITIGRFMAFIESKTNLKGESALAQWASQYVE